VLRPLVTAVLLLLIAPATGAAAPVATLPDDMEVPESAGAVVIPVTLTEPSDESVRVNWQTGSARIADAPGPSGDRDLVPERGTLEFAPGETRQELTIHVIDDAVDDHSIFMSVELPGRRTPTGAEESMLVLIVDDEPTPPASIASVRVEESAGDTVVPITRPGVSLLGLALYAWRAQPVTAAPADLAAVEGRGAIGPGTQTGEARIPIVDDAVRERDETFTVELAPWAGPIEPFRSTFPGPVAGGPATITIADDDTGAATLSSVTRVRGLVRLDGVDVVTPLELRRGAKVDARRGAARLAISTRGRPLRAATVARGTVRAAGAATMALVTPTLRIETARGMRFRGRTVTAAAARPGARWSMAETARGTRVRVRRGAVRADGAVLRAGTTRVFR
jgi:hypothetical protein